MAATESFTAYEEEWFSIKAGVISKLDKDCVVQQGEQRKATLRRVTMELEEADEIVEQLEMEGKGKAKLMIRVRGYKSEIKGWRTRVAQLSASTDRSTLLSNPPSSSRYAIDVDPSDLPTSTVAAQRTRLLSSTQTLSTSSGRLDNAQRLALEAEEIGGTVLGTLQDQRNVLEEARDGLETSEGNVRRARGTIGKMVRKMYQQRVIMGVMIAVLSLMILLVLWNKFR